MKTIIFYTKPEIVCNKQICIISLFASFKCNRKFKKQTPLEQGLRYVPHLLLHIIK
jgi:hypothetical protein